MGPVALTHGALPARRLVALLVLTWHWFACIWWCIVETDEHFGRSADPQVAADLETRSSYMLAFHWAISVTTGLGAPVHAASTGQSFFEALVVCIGIAMQSFFFGTVASVVGAIDEGTRMRQRKLDSVHQYVRLKRVPPFVRHRVLSYYEYVRRARRRPIPAFGCRAKLALAAPA